MKAVRSKCILERVTVEKDTGGIFIPESVQAGKEKNFVVQCVGPDVDLPGLEEGSIVYIDVRKAVPMKEDGKDYIVVDQDDIMAIK